MDIHHIYRSDSYFSRCTGSINVKQPRPGACLNVNPLLGGKHNFPVIWHNLIFTTEWPILDSSPSLLSQWSHQWKQSHQWTKLSPRFSWHVLPALSGKLPNWNTSTTSHFGRIISYIHSWGARDAILQQWPHCDVLSQDPNPERLGLKALCSPAESLNKYWDGVRVNLQEHGLCLGQVNCYSGQVLVKCFILLCFTWEVIHFKSIFSNNEKWLQSSPDGVC